HTYQDNLSNLVPKKDSRTGSAGTSNVQDSAIHQHPLNVDPTVANVLLVKITVAANGTQADQWSKLASPNDEFRIIVNVQASQENRELHISDNENILNFYGSVINVTGIIGSANNGSVKYSLKNLILWGGNRIGPEDEFYSDGAKECW
ncbi:MAG: hypothetical protein EZS28_045138, partial [Streblomastix strix]